MDEKPIISIIMGSTSDLPLMKKAMDVLEALGISFDVQFLSAHRTPGALRGYISFAKGLGVRVFITGAGMSNALSGTVKAWAKNTPVIGVPLSGTPVESVAAVLATLEMPPGVVVATVALDGAQNAGILAVEMLALSDEKLDEELSTYKVTEQKKKDEKAVTALTNLKLEFKFFKSLNYY